ncbi:hypothetical protein J7E97_09965 [Streptomyces sp. ISL-66]|uniref:hypothetical protein n=1 Tax=Streptomyces sp. ISL-66 TaxID=2819186 RepID=UPI001BEC0DCA|nr:hypothetical protein [Streptomyces sp. ISL-66]MBT2468194.1 hypothetical protein [Streptomyces sp. ISL-66]
MAGSEGPHAEADHHGPIPRLVRNDLIPAFGTLKLDQLAHRHISAYVTAPPT